MNFSLLFSLRDLNGMQLPPKAVSESDMLPFTEQFGPSNGPGRLVHITICP